MPLTELTVVSEQVAFGLRRPIALTGLPDGPMLIAEKNGTVRAYHPDTGLAAEPVLDLTARVDTSGNERGLLGITPAPDFARTGMLYVAYTSLPDGELTLARSSTLAFAVRPRPWGGYESAIIGNFPIQPTAIDADVHGELYALSDLPGWLSRVRFERVQPAPSSEPANR